MQNLKKTKTYLGKIFSAVFPLVFFIIVFLLAKEYFQDKDTIIIDSLKWIFR